MEKFFFDNLIKNKKGTFENIIEMEINNDDTTGNLLNYEYLSNYYKLIAIDLRKQIELENPTLKQQIKFTGRLEEDNIAMFFIIKKSEEITFNF